MWKTKTSRLGTNLPSSNVHQKPELKKITTLVNKALTSTSLKEKNDILQEMRVLWIPQNEELENISASNQGKLDELNVYQKKQLEITQQCENLKQNTSFYHHTDYARSKKNESSIIRSIKSIENELGKISSVSSPQSLNDALSLSTSPDKQIFTLIDLNLARLEEMAYAYKKRLLIVEQSQESTDVVLKEFGSVNGLLESEKKLEMENEQLKNEEKSYINDAFTRRRKFAEMSPNVARSMAMVFSKTIEYELEAINRYIKYSFPIEIPKQSSIAFEQICNDKGFDTSPMQFDESEFGSTSEELAEKLISTTNSSERISIIHELNHQMELNNIKLMNEISISRQKKRQRVEGPQTRVEKLNDENERLFIRIQDAQTNLDQRNQESAMISHEVIGAIKIRSNHKQSYINLAAKIRDLSISHSQLKGKLIENKIVLSTLLYIVSSFGNQLLNGNAKISPISDMFSRTIKQIEKQILDNEVALSPAVDSSHAEAHIEETPSMLHMASRTRKNPKGRRTNHGNDRIKKYSSSMSLIGMEKDHQNENTTLEQRKPLVNSSKAELLNGISYAMDLAGFVIGDDRRYHQTISSSLKGIFEDLQYGAMQHVNEYGRGFSEAITRIRYLSNGILVKSKDHVALQTEAAPRSEEEAQTIESGIIKQKKK